MSETINTATSLGTRRGRKKTSPTGFSVYLPSMEVDGSKDIVMQAPTGLAGPGTPVRVVVPHDFPVTEIFVGDACVVGPNLVRLHFSNSSLHRTRAREVMVQILPYEERRSLFPEVTFDE